MEFYSSKYVVSDIGTQTFCEIAYIPHSEFCLLILDFFMFNNRKKSTDTKSGGTRLEYNSYIMLRHMDLN